MVVVVGATPPPDDRSDDGDGPGKRDDGRGHGKSDGPHGEEWLTIETPLATFKLNPYTGAIGCHCKKHACRYNRVGRKQPIGVFAAWLGVCTGGRRYKTCKSHCEAKTDWVGILSYAERVKARKWMEADPAYAPLFEWEYPKRGAEPYLVSG